jgi:hypothetical protein
MMRFASLVVAVYPQGCAWSYDRAVAWRAKCYECGQVVGITRPVFETASLFAAGNLPAATASYEAHAGRPGDTRRCSGVGKVVPQYQMRGASSTTPGEDPPTVDPRGVRR